ncbi:MAG: SLC13 family permease [bacterium]|nr:SLC13 family permease [bacterium]
MDPQYLALFIFAAAYVLFVILAQHRVYVAAAASIAILACGVLTLPQAVASINWNVIGIFVGNLIVADILVESRAPAYFAEVIVQRAPNTAWAILFICTLTGFVSAFVDNVATVLLVAPVALSVAHKLALNPKKILIGIAISSNLQGAATLIGDTPSMLLATAAGMDFVDFFFWHGKPGIFFAVQCGAAASFFVLYLVFRSLTTTTDIGVTEKVRSWFPTILLSVLVSTLALVSLIPSRPSYTAGLICMLAGFVAILWEKFVNKGSIIDGLRSLDYETTFFLMGIFILVGSVSATGWIERFANLLAKLVGTNVLAGYILLISVAVILSAIVDNIPFLAAMLPVVTDLCHAMHINPTLYYFGLLIGASLGGNITPIGASANIVACGLLKKEGYPVRFSEFMAIGLPFTLTATTAAALFIWWVWR